MKLTIEKLEFPSVIKEKILKYVHTSTLTIDFINGKNIIFKKTNLAIQEPHKIIISNKSFSLVVFVYENDENFYVNDLFNSVSLTKLIKIINQMM